MIKISSTRHLYGLGCLVIFLLLGTSFYLEYATGITPCPLCILQRLTIAVLGVVFFFAALLPLQKIGHIVIAITASFLTLLGIFLSGRQVWLQHLPMDQNADCGVSLQYLLKVLPLQEALQKIFQGTAECAQTGGQFFYLSLAEWSLIWFCLFLFFSLYQLKKVWLNK